MAIISASMVKDLREKTGAGMLDCKKALEECKGQMEDAIDWLRKKGLSNAAKKAGRVAAEGLVAICLKGKEGAIIEVNSETDFVARNDAFQKFVADSCKAVLDHKAQDVSLLATKNYPGKNHSIADELTHLIATVGENMTLRRCHTLSVDQGQVYGYVHNQVVPNLGKIAVLVALESSASAASLENLGKQLAMHIAATSPQALNVEAVDPASVDREKQIFVEQAKASGKPTDVIAKMVEGRIRKFYEEIVLLEQVFALGDGKTKIKDMLADASKSAGTPIVLKAYIRYGLGEGIEKKQDDFAEEVAAQLRA